MKKLRNIIIIILIIIFIVIVSLIFLLKKDIDESQEDFSIPYGDERVIEKKINRVNKNIDYYSIELIVKSYLDSIILQDNDMLYNTLNPESINELDINKENIVSRLNNIINMEDNVIDHYKFIISDMYFSESEGNINTYFVYVKIINTVSENIIRTSLMVETDTINDTYYILPFEYMNNKGYLNIEEGQEYSTNMQTIENNLYNEIQYENLDEYTIILNFMTRLTDELVYDIDNSYDLFDDEYKKIKFDTLDKYKNYINNNIKYIISSSIKKYKINVYDDYIEYVCIDQNGNYYIFNETSPMQFTLRLDTYTIDVPEFIERYNKGNEQIKVGMNIEKVIQALNNKDYNYIYGKLDETFKQNNFNTIDKFDIYMKDNFFEINKANYEEFSKEGEIYIYKLKIKESEEGNANSKDVTVIMKLLEDTNFVMSFSVD